MRLNDIVENTTRRSFLKSAATAVAGASKLSGSQVADAMSSAAKSAAKNFERQIAVFRASGLTAFNLEPVVHAIAMGDMSKHNPDGSFSAYVWDDAGELVRKAVSKDVITGFLADEMASDEYGWVKNLSGDDINLDDFLINQFDGVLDVFLKSAYNKLGRNNFIRMIINMGRRSKGTYIADLHFGDEYHGFYALGKVAERMPELGLDPSRLIGKVPVAIRELHLKNVISQEEATQLSKSWFEFEDRYSDTLKRNKQKDKNKKSEEIVDKKTDDIELDDFDRWADDGGAITAFESRLMKILS